MEMPENIMMTLLCRKYHILFLTVFLFWGSLSVSGQTVAEDSISGKGKIPDRYASFYDSLKVRAEHNKFTRFLHHLLIKNPRGARRERDSINRYPNLEGCFIKEIKIIRLDVFGPSIKDTSRKANYWYEKAGNLLHTRSDLHNIRKNLIVKKGDLLNYGDLYEGERLLRALPYIRDARFFASEDSLLPGFVNLVLVTQDRFSLGLSGGVNGSQSADVEVFNHNIFGIGHELSARFVGHLRREPYLGIEAFYKINNIGGKFITFSAGYLNTFENEGAEVTLNKEFLRTSDKWGYGLSGYYFDRTYHLPLEQIPVNPDLIGYYQYGAWGGRNFQTGKGPENSQLTLSFQFFQRHFTSRPPADAGMEQYYLNRNLFLTGLTWSKRIFKTDELVYSYGITEDIPKGFKYELVMGIDNNESGNRLYSHINLANANLMRGKPSHLFFSAGFSTFFRQSRIEQGLAEFSTTFISPLLNPGNARFRQFLTLNYKLGINRLKNEKLYFENNNLIRGFNSNEVWGRQRLSLNSEVVYFQKHDFYRFNLAFFTFVDIGLLAGENDWILKGQPYSGLGVGLRLHNESLALKTLQIRLSFYPNHPGDVGLVGFLVNEQLRQRLYSFQPVAPAPRRFN